MHKKRIESALYNALEKPDTRVGVKINTFRIFFRPAATNWLPMSGFCRQAPALFQYAHKREAEGLKADIKWNVRER